MACFAVRWRVPKSVPQMERPTFDEFLKLDHHLFEFVAFRNRTKRAAMMRPVAGTPLPVNGSFFDVPVRGLNSWEFFPSSELFGVTTLECVVRFA
jgi:hypothetical protein